MLATLLVLVAAQAPRPLSPADATYVIPQLGGRIVRVRDADGDGVADLLHEFAHADADLGSVRVISGKSGRLLREIPGPDPIRDDRSLADVGDLDGDGVHDIAIGDNNFGFPRAAPGSPALDVRSMTMEQAATLHSDPDAMGFESGCVVVHSGRTGAVLFGVWAPREPRNGLGYDVLRGPDADGDGIDDLVVADAYKAYVLRVPEFGGANAR